jgi:RecA-family ATPase
MQLLPGSPSIALDLQNRIWQPRQYFSWGLNYLADVPLDNFMPFLTTGQLCVFAGAEGSGKTTWSTQMALLNAIALKGKLNVGYLSLEVDPYRVITRKSERKARIDRFQLRDGIEDPLELLKLQTATSLAISEFLDSGLCLFPQLDNEESDAANIAAIRNLCGQEFGPSLLFIDNLCEIQPEKEIKDEYARYDYIVRELLKICRGTSTTIVLLHHLGKPKLGDKVTINSVKGNNIILTKADLVVLIDKHLIPNPNWLCRGIDKKQKPVNAATRKRFMAQAPMIEVRSVESQKDRDWDVRGEMGYLIMEDGIVKIMNNADLRLKFPLFGNDQEAFRAALDENDLFPYMP